MDRSRPDTPLERDIYQALEELADEGKLNPDDLDWPRINEAVEEALRSSGLSVADRLEETMHGAITDEEAHRVGFESRLYRIWGGGLDRLHALIIAAREAGSELLHEESRAGRRTLTIDTVARIHARCCLVASEGLTLLRAGYASGANARWRSLHELAVVAFFIADQGDDVAERFILHANVSALSQAESEREHSASLGIAGPADPDLLALRTAVDRLVNRFGPSYRSDYGWAAGALGDHGPTFRKIEAHVRMGHLRPFYKIASDPIHAGPAGVLEDLGAEASRDTILLSGASNTGLRIPGQGLAIALNQATTALLMADITADRILVMFSLTELSKRCTEAFAWAGADADRLTDISHGHRARQAVFARRRARLAASRLHTRGRHGPLHLRAALALIRR